MLNASEIHGRQALVMGLGRFGGGAGVTHWLVEPGASVLLTDLSSADALQSAITPIVSLIEAGSVETRLGEHRVEDFERADLVVANPAVPAPWDNEFLNAARLAGIPITTEIGLVAANLPSRERVIGVTGSAGKSTTSAMIAHILERALDDEHVWLGGNIGGSLLPSLRDIGAQDWIVLELSSFMLHWLGQPAGSGWSPGIAVMTNLAPNHLDWHGSFEHYRESKAQILASQRAGDLALFGDESTRREFSGWLVEGVNAQAPRRDESRGRIDLEIPGRHNQANAELACATAVSALGLERPSQLERALHDFRGLPHRLELVTAFAPNPGDPPIRFFNDSKSTTPEAAMRAVDAIADESRKGARSIHLIAGGHGKGVDLSALAARASELAGLYAIGATGEALVGSAPSGGPAFHDGTLDRAFEHVMRRVRPGDVVLLSPGCASWDQFASFEERGARFACLACEAEEASLSGSKS